MTLPFYAHRPKYCKALSHKNLGEFRSLPMEEFLKLPMKTQIEFYLDTCSCYYEGRASVLHGMEISKEGLKIVPAMIQVNNELNDEYVARSLLSLLRSMVEFRNVDFDELTEYDMHTELRKMMESCKKREILPYAVSDYNYIAQTHGWVD